MCSIVTYFLWKTVITNLCFHEMANPRATVCSCTGCALRNSRTLSLDCTINDALCVMQSVHCSWYSPWHVYDLYRLKTDQQSGSPWLDFHCIFGTNGCVFLINAFLGHILHNYGSKRYFFTLLEEVRLLKPLCWWVCWSVTTLGSQEQVLEGKQPLLLFWPLRSACLGKTCSETHWERNNVCVTISRAALNKEFLSSHSSSKGQVPF